MAYERTEKRRLHPGWPLWGLRLAQLLGEPMGLWAESAAVARDILATAGEGRRPNYQPVVAAMARVLLAEASLGDLRFEEACATAGDAWWCTGHRDSPRRPRAGFSA